MRLNAYPPSDRWEDWTELDSKSWPRKVEKRYTIVPTVCFNCEASCGMLAYVDRQTLEIRKLEGNPHSPNSRGRVCAKGPATLSQVNDPERILWPMKREGPRGSGKWRRVTWEEVLNDLGARVRKAILEKRFTEIMYHVGRPGEDGWMQRTFQGWGLDAHNSHTNVCSSGARLGYDLWMGNDRPSPDFANARYILLLSSHLETGHYFNPHAQRIMDAKLGGATLAVMDSRLSNTASQATVWLPTWPGSEAAVLLAMANVIIQRELYDKEFVRRWTNWEEYLRNENIDPAFPNFVKALKGLYAMYTPEFAEDESGLDRRKIEKAALDIARAGKAFASHVWRNATSGNLHGWLVARAIFFLNVLTGSVGTVGGVLPNLWNKFVPKMPNPPAPQKVWSELLWPREYPFTHHEMSILLPHFLKDRRGKLDVYFSRTYNPVWTNPDGFSWMEVLKDESKIACHATMTPVWNETAWFADYVLPMGLGPERHDTMSFESHASKWITFRQPVRRVAMERMGKKTTSTLGANPGEVWEEDEFWIELSWRIDPDGALGIRRHFESPYRPGEKLTMDDFFGWTFENGVPGLPEKAKSEGLTPLAYMRKHGAFEVAANEYEMHERPKEDGVEIEGVKRTGFATPSKKLEFWSKTLADWGWKEYALPTYAHGHVHRSRIDASRNEYCLLPTFRLPTQIHTRSGNSKWLAELSHANPMWIHTKDARRLGVRSGDLVRVETEIGHFVNRAMVTEAIMPGVVGCSHHFGRWRVEERGNDRWLSSLVRIEEKGDGRFAMRQVEGARPFESTDPDSRRIWWREVGVHQNLTFPVHPDPLSGMHCWHQKVRVVKAGPADRYGDVEVDTRKSMDVYRQWLAMTRPAPGPGGLRRPMWLQRPFKPAPEAYQIP